MKVIALKQGYFGKLRQPDDQFEVPDGTKGSWFQPVKPVKPEAEAKGGKKPEAAEPPSADLV